MKGSKIAFWEAVVQFDLGHGDDSCDRRRTWDASALFSWQAQYFVDLDKKVAETKANVVFVFFNSHISWRAQGLVKNPGNFIVILGLSSLSLRCGITHFEIMARNFLVTLGVSDRSHCGVVLILKWFAQLSRHFVLVGSLLSWHGAHFEFVRATQGACQIAFVVVRC